MIEYGFSYSDLEYFLLIFMRVASFIYVAPFFSMSNTPRNIRIVFSFFFAVLLYQVVPRVDVSYQTLIGYTILVLKEVVVGLLIGFAANMCATVVTFAGQIADMEMGLSMASLFDPTTKETSTITGIYYNYMILLMMTISGLHRYLIQALTETFSLIPISGAILNSDALLSSMIEFLSNYILIGFRICLPVFAVMLILNAVLGILAKVSPQLNMFAVGIQMKVIVGLCVLFLTTVMLPDAADLIYMQMKRIVVSFVEAMR